MLLRRCGGVCLSAAAGGYSCCRCCCRYCCCAAMAAFSCAAVVQRLPQQGKNNDIKMFHCHMSPGADSLPDWRFFFIFALLQARTPFPYGHTSLQYTQFVACRCCISLLG